MTLAKGMYNYYVLSFKCFSVSEPSIDDLGEGYVCIILRVNYYVSVLRSVSEPSIKLTLAKGICM